MPLLKKRCTICDTVKLLGMFVKDKKMKDGHLNQCSACRYKRDKRTAMAKQKSRSIGTPFGGRSA
jgi:hypothetical protein